MATSSKKAKVTVNKDEDYCQESDFDSDSTPSSCDYPMLSPPAQRKKTCQGMVTTRQQSLVFSMAGWHPVALAPQAMMLPAQSVSRLTSPNNVQLPTDLTVLQQQLRTTASSGDVPLPPASSGDVPLPPASSGDVPLPPASFGDVPIKPASSGDDRMKTTVTIRRVILILMAHLFQATCTTTQCCHHLQKGRKHAKVFNDPIHGHMEFPGLCVKIIDTPQFQRLRYLKQLGAGYFVFPDASHNRFEHSLGVCHLAGLLVTELGNRQSELGITPEDVLCVSIAGLCHDLGHGPFSHVFDNKFIPAVIPDSKWKHEDASLAMFDHMVKENKLEEDFGKCHLTAPHREFIKALIMGKPTDDQEKELLACKWYKKKEKAFLYEIVANKRNGVDVDKWDYFQRDCHHLGMTSSFDLKRFIKFARVITVSDPDTKKEESQICYRDKEAFNMYQLFHTRFTLHHRAYQHKTVQAVELMLVDAMREADKFLKIPGDDGEEWKISECIHHMDAYTKLTDDVIHQILLSKGEGPNSPDEERAKKIVNDLQQRKLHKCVGEIVVPVLADDYMPKSEKSVEKEIEEFILKKTGQDKLNERIRIQVSTLDYGKKVDNPVNDVRFWKKNKPDTAVPFKAVEVSFLVPQFCFKEQLVRVFFKTGASDDKEYIAKLQQVCRDWCEEQKDKRTKGEHADKFGKHASGTFYPTFH